jgi:hypothetical protein
MSMKKDVIFVVLVVWLGMITLFLYNQNKNEDDEGTWYNPIHIALPSPQEDDQEYTVKIPAIKETIFKAGDYIVATRRWDGNGAYTRNIIKVIEVTDHHVLYDGYDGAIEMLSMEEVKGRGFVRASKAMIYQYKRER